MISWGVILLLSVPCMAQDDDDLFDALDSELEQSPEADISKSEQGFVSQFGTNLTGSITFRYDHFWQEPQSTSALDNQLDIVEAWLKAETFAARDAWRVDLSGWIDIGNSEDTYAGVREFMQDQDSRRRIFQINDMYGTWSDGNLDVKAGLKVFQNGISTLWSPANIHAPIDFHDPTNARRLGKWLVELDYAIDTITLTGVVFPVPEENKIPGGTSRWLSNSDDFYFRALANSGGGPVIIETDSPEVAFDNFSYLGKAKAVMRGWDVFLSAYYGLNPYYVLKRSQRVLPGPITETTYTKTTTKVIQLAGGFSTTHNAWEFHGEGNYNWSYDKRDDSYLSYVGGFTYTWDDFGVQGGLDKILLTAEYAGEWLTSSQVAKGSLYQSSREARLGRNDLIGRLEIMVNQDWKFMWASHFELTDDGHFQRFQTSYKFIPNLKGTLGFDLFGGSKSSYHGRWGCNDRVYTELTYSF